jgi:hypothetical protein
VPNHSPRDVLRANITSHIYLLQSIPVASSKVETPISRSCATFVKNSSIPNAITRIEA